MSNGRVVLLVEDEALIALYLEELMSELRIRFVGPVTTMAEAVRQARTAKIDAAVLNWIIEGQPAHAVAEALDDRGIPFGFASGALKASVDPKWANRPFVTKPYTLDGLRDLLNALLGNASTSSQPA